jgi:CRISPR-associated DxTHG motif protein
MNDIKVITILGTTVGDATYHFSATLTQKYQLNKRNYANMFQLLNDNFSSIVPIYTLQAKMANQQFNPDVFLNEGFITDENDYLHLFEQINKVLTAYDDASVIIDISHGFRHIPILTTIALISHTIEDMNKIKHIFFAKEIEQYKRYEIVDLKGYLEIAHLSYILSSFSENYTIGNHIVFDTEAYQELVDSLRLFSSHMLANSFREIYDQKLLKKMIRQITKLKKDSLLGQMRRSLNEILDHLRDIDLLEEKTMYQQLYALAVIMNDRGYLLNSVTLLNEAVGLYAIDQFKGYSQEIKTFFDGQEKKALELQDKLNRYEIAKAGKKAVLNQFPDRVFTKESITKSVKEKIRDSRSSEDMRKLIKQLDELRNNLAHANSGVSIENVQQALTKGFKTFHECIEQRWLSL